VRGEYTSIINQKKAAFGWAGFLVFKNLDKAGNLFPLGLLWHLCCVLKFISILTNEVLFHAFHDSEMKTLLRINNEFKLSINYQYNKINK
jgi:hypothetical protein